MECIFFENGECWAGYKERAVGWKVDADTKKKYCITEDFRSCERFLSKMEILTKK